MVPSRREPETSAPRIVVAGLSGDAGKTLVSLALVLALRERGMDVRAFKKGPDYIDAAWLSWASGAEARNLDTWMAGFESVQTAFARHAMPSGMNLVEGNRGLFDGVDAAGTHSTAELAKRLGAPVLLVVDARKTTRTVAALVLGCRALDPDVEIAGVVLNRVAGARHEAIAREAVETACGVRVVGAIPRLEGEHLPGRHLGLVTPEEHGSTEQVRRLALDVAAYLDLAAIDALARRVAPLPAAEDTATRHSPRATPESSGGVTIAYLRDSAFSFYYPENLEALQDAGASLVAVSSLADARLPSAVHGLYIGGGFPETHGARLAHNRPLLECIRRAAEDGMPTYAECGGLMLLSRAFWHDGERHEMAGVFPFEVEMCRRPQGHGYATLVVDQPNAFFRIGTTLNGHEFHYSRIRADAAGGLPTACEVRRGTGCAAGRDAVMAGNVWASYVHLHADAAPGWAPAFVNAAARFRNESVSPGASEERTPRR
jgi:cobyrinic acid a,c-diamide synthase